MKLSEQSIGRHAPVRCWLFVLLLATPIAVGILLSGLSFVYPSQFDNLANELDLFSRLSNLIFHGFIIDNSNELPPARNNIDSAVLLINTGAIALQVIFIVSAIFSYRSILPGRFKRRFGMSARRRFSPMKNTALTLGLTGGVIVSDLFFGGLLVHFLEFRLGELVSFGLFLWRATLLFLFLEVCINSSVIFLLVSIIDP